MYRQWVVSTVDIRPSKGVLLGTSEPWVGEEQLHVFRDKRPDDLLDDVQLVHLALSREDGLTIGDLARKENTTIHSTCRGKCEGVEGIVRGVSQSVG